jgi:hypothetical protein
MLKGKYRTVATAVLMGAIFFSPLVCGMTCLEARGQKTSVGADGASAAGEFVGEFVESGVVGCVVWHVVLNMDWSDWTEAVQVGTRVWVGVDAVEYVGEMLRK